MTRPTPLDEIVAAFRQTHPSLNVRAMAGYNDRIINVGPANLVERTHMDALRAALTDGGWVEVDSWIATEGLSWLSDGIQSVSLRVNPKPPTQP